MVERMVDAVRGVGMLQKEPQKRITLEELLVHPLIAGKIDGIRELRKGATKNDSFKFFSYNYPNSLKLYEEPLKALESTQKSSS